MEKCKTWDMEAVKPKPQKKKKNPYYCWLKPVFIKGEGENLQCCVLKNSLASTAKAYYFTPSLLDVLPLNMMPHPARSINNLVPPMHTCSTPFTLFLKTIWSTVLFAQQLFSQLWQISHNASAEEQTLWEGKKGTSPWLKYETIRGNSGTQRATKPVWDARHPLAFTRV